jgi:hypothetical protein
MNNKRKLALMFRVSQLAIHAMRQKKEDSCDELLGLYRDLGSARPSDALLAWIEALTAISHEAGVALSAYSVKEWRKKVLERDDGREEIKPGDYRYYRTPGARDA